LKPGFKATAEVRLNEHGFSNCSTCSGNLLPKVADAYERVSEMKQILFALLTAGSDSTEQPEE